MGQHVWVGALCVAAGLVAAFWPLVRHGPSTPDPWPFLATWDDDGNFIHNDLIRSGFSADNLRNMAAMTLIGVWEPMSWALRTLMFTTCGESGLAVRRSTLAFHMASCAVLLLLTRNLVLAHVRRQWRWKAVVVWSRERQGQLPSESSVLRQHARQWSHVVVRVTVAATVATALYAVHPLHAEVVGWPSAGSYAPAALLLHVSLLFAQSRGGSAVLLAATTVTYIAAVMFKSVALLMPVALVAIDWVAAAQNMAIAHAARCATSNSVLAEQAAGADCGDATKRASVGTTVVEGSDEHLGVVAFASACFRSAIARWPLFVAMAVLLQPIVTANQGEEGTRTVIDTIQLTSWERVAKSMVTPWYFLSKTLAPVFLRPHVSITEGVLSFSDPACSVAPWCAAATALLAGFAVRHYLRRPYVLSACGYFIIMMLPTLGVVQHGMVQLAGDRYAYLSLAALVPLVAGALAYHLPGASAMTLRTRAVLDGQRACDGHDGTASDASHAGGTSISATTVASRMMLSWPAAAVGVVLALLILTTGRQILVWQSDQALWDYSLRVDPTDWRANAIWGEHLVFQRKLEEAQPYFVEELKYMPSVHRGIQPCMERAKSLYLVGRADEACLLYEWAFHRWANAEESGELYTNLGVCALRAGEVDRARKLMQQAHQLLPGSESIRINWEAIQQFKLGTGKPFKGTIVW